MLSLRRAKASEQLNESGEEETGLMIVSGKSNSRGRVLFANMQMCMLLKQRKE